MSGTLGRLKSAVTGHSTYASLYAGLIRSRWQNHLPYDIYNPGQGAYINKNGTYGFLFELNPLYFIGVDEIYTLVGILKNQYPDMSTFQTILHASEDIDPIINDFMRGIKTKNPLLRTACEEQARFLLKGKHGLKEFGGGVVRNYRLFLAMSFPNPKNEMIVPKALEEIMEGAIKTLGGIGLNPRPFAPEALINWGVKLYNDPPAMPWLPYNPDKSISEQIIKAETEIREEEDHIKVGNKYVYCLTPFAMPKEPLPHEVRQLVGGKDGPVDDAIQIKQPFIWSTTIIFDSSINPGVKQKLFWASKQEVFGAFIDELKDRFVDLKEMYRGTVKNMPNVWVFPTLVVYGTEKDKVEAAVSNVRNVIWPRAGFEMQVETKIKKDTFLATHPFGFAPTPMGIKGFARMNAANGLGALTVSPWQADYKGYGGVSDALYIGRNGQLITKSAWGGDSYDTLTVAPKGSGKSVDLNYDLMLALARSEQVFAFEMGNSLADLCRIVRGRHIKFNRDPENVTCLNPFELLQPASSQAGSGKEEMEIDHGPTAIIIYNMIAANSGTPPTDSQISVIIDAIQHEYSNNGPETHIGNIAEFLLSFPKNSALVKRYPEFSKATLTETAHHMGYVLEQNGWCPGGVNSRWVNGKNTLDIQNYPMALFEAKELSQNKALFTVVSMLAMDYISKAVWMGDINQRKVVAIDEAPVFFEQMLMLAKYLGNFLRQIRKFNGRINLVIQGFTDLSRMADNVGPLIINNTSRRKMLGMRHDQIAAAVAAGVLEDKEALKKYVASIRTVQGQYSEIFAQDPGGGWGAQRLVLAPYLRAMYTTQPDERGRLNHLKEILRGNMDFHKFIEGYNMANPSTPLDPNSVEDFESVVADIAIREYVKETYGEV